MRDITRILCAVDFSEFSQHAVDHAAALAHWYGAQLTILHVFVNRPVLDLPPPPMADADREQIDTNLHRLVAHVPVEVRLDLRVREAADAHREILKEAEAVNADLLVLGTHGRSGFERLMLGSVTERVIRKASCPTLIVPSHAPDADPDEPVRLRRILCAVDFSETSARALRYALSLGEGAPAQITLLYAIEVPPELHTDPMAEGFSVEKTHAAAEAESLSRLRCLVRALPQGAATIKTVVREGPAYREILKVAAERSADLIVMGVHGRGALDLMVYGSNTARVTRGATCPVLVVPGPD